MKTKTLIQTLGSALLLLGLTAATTPAAQAQVVKRDLQEWLDAQGTFLAPHPLLPQTPRIFNFVNNPDINGDGVADGPKYLLWCDYAGVLARNSSYGGLLGPESIDGKVTERPIGGGMAEVTVQVRVSGALIWATTFGDGSGNHVRSAPTVFGHRETELQLNPDLELALADVHFTTTFLNEVGAPFPDLIAAAGAGRWLSFQLVINATGPLTEEFGVPDGTPGALHWGKPGLLSTPANANADNGAASLFPNDQFKLFPIGRP